MGWMPGATRRDVGAPGQPPNYGVFSNGPMHSYTGVVLHVNDSQGDQITSINGDSLYDWIIGNHGMSCHFQVSQTGGIEQYIDTAFSSWCQEDGNDDYLSIETEGLPTEPLTAAQVTACAQIMAYANTQHGIPLLLADRPGWRGLGWHGMGGAAWGGHTSCPGDLRKAQRAQILAAAAVLTGGGSTAQKGPFMTLPQPTLDAMVHQVGNTDLLIKSVYEWTKSTLLRVASIGATQATQAASLTALDAALEALKTAPPGSVDFGPVLAAIAKLPAEVRAVFETDPLTLGGTAK